MAVDGAPDVWLRPAVDGDAQVAGEGSLSGARASDSPLRKRRQGQGHGVAVIFGAGAGSALKARKSFDAAREVGLEGVWLPGALSR
jgi:hypothetical protein